MWEMDVIGASSRCCGLPTGGGALWLSVVVSPASVLAAMPPARSIDGDGDRDGDEDGKGLRGSSTNDLMGRMTEAAPAVGDRVLNIITRPPAPPMNISCSPGAQNNSYNSCNMVVQNAYLCVSASQWVSHWVSHLSKKSSSTFQRSPTPSDTATQGSDETTPINERERRQSVKRGAQEIGCLPGPPWKQERSTRGGLFPAWDPPQGRGGALQRTQKTHQHY